SGSAEDEGTVQVEWAERGRFRGDFYASGPVGGAGADTFYSVSGFYRYDEGTLVSGLPTEGYQIRGNLKRDFADGSGSFTLLGQLIDDEVQFFLPIPLDGESRERVTGNDGEEVFTLNTAEAAQLRFNTPDGVFESPIDEGVATQGGSIAAVYDRDLGDGWGLNIKTKYASYSHDFNLFLDGDGDVNQVETLTSFLENRDLGALENASFTFTETGQAVPDDFLLFPNRLLDRVRDATDFSGELNITKDVSFAGAEHRFTLGSYLARAEADDFNVITTYLADFRNEPKLVDLTIIDVDGTRTGTPGAEFQVTQNGVLNANGVTGDRERSALRYAIYGADQIETDRWLFDVGFRVETLEGDILQRNTVSTQVSDDPFVNDAIENISFPDGTSLQDSVSATEWAAAVSGLYKLSDEINLFGNFSRGFFFPQLNGQSFNDPNNPGEVSGDYESEIILSAEFGAKLDFDRWRGYATGFWTELSDRQSVEFRNDPNNPGGLIDEVVTQSTRALGVEAGGSFDLLDNLSINGNVTFRDIEFTEFEQDPDLVGNELRRQPELIFNTGATYDDGRFDVTLAHNYHGSNFANDANTIELDAYHLVRLEGGYTQTMANGDRLRASVNVFNLFDSQGVTEGSPRQGNLQSGDAEFFVGRPILPRRVTVRFTYDF
ncbi:MAG: TonB-dependent receptor, partial [Caulobacterales bacterium]|nr:TonB-dependent receptor [Caulobacterales bacterium]